MGETGLLWSPLLPSPCGRLSPLRPPQRGGERGPSFRCCPHTAVPRSCLHPETDPVGCRGRSPGLSSPAARTRAQKPEPLSVSAGSQADSSVVVSRDSRVRGPVNPLRAALRPPAAARGRTGLPKQPVSPRPRGRVAAARQGAAGMAPQRLLLLTPSPALSRQPLVRAHLSASGSGRGLGPVLGVCDRVRRGRRKAAGEAGRRARGGGGRPAQLFPVRASRRRPERLRVRGGRLGWGRPEAERRNGREDAPLSG